MSIGVIVGAFIDTEYFLSLKKIIANNRIAFYIIELLLFISIMYLIIIRNSYEMLAIILFPCAIIYTQIDKSLINLLFNRKIFSSINKLSYGIYCLHGFAVNSLEIVFNKIELSNAFIQLVLLYGSLFAVSAIVNKVLKTMKLIN